MASGSGGGAGGEVGLRRAVGCGGGESLVPMVGRPKMSRVAGAYEDRNIFFRVNAPMVLTK